jgi:hypothetical protein
MEKMRELLRELRPHFVFWVFSSICAEIGSWVFPTLRSHLSLVWAFLGGALVAFAVLRIVGLFSTRTSNSHSKRQQAGLPLPKEVHPTSTTGIRVLRDNVAMEKDLDRILENPSASIERVLVLQYSGRNIIDAVNEILLRTKAHVELYLADPKTFFINEHQQERIETFLSKDLVNQLQRKARRTGTLEVFTYKAPASQRFVLLDREMLYLGAYFYQVKPIGKELPGGQGRELKLDTRGGEMPLLAIPPDHEAFDVLAAEIKEMINNWKEHGVVHSQPLAQKQGS